MVDIEDCWWHLADTPHIAAIIVDPETGERSFAFLSCCDWVVDIVSVVAGKRKHLGH